MITDIFYTDEKKFQVRLWSETKEEANILAERRNSNKIGAFTSFKTPYGPTVVPFDYFYFNYSTNEITEIAWEVAEICRDHWQSLVGEKG